MEIARNIKRAIIRSRLRPSTSVEWFTCLLRLGQWLRGNNTGPHLTSREELYQHVIGIIGDTNIDYLEFGVFQGRTMRLWADKNQSERSRFFGFDTFTGLPEQWNVFGRSVEQGHFDTEGKTPDIDDPRVSFVEGLFQDTLPTFLENYTPQAQLVLHCDADLYTSTLFVLTTMHRLLTPGSILIFDDFSVANHDFRAFSDYVSSYRRKYTVLCTAETAWEKVAIKMA